jgi:rod shape determining protein RodA
MRDLMKKSKGNGSYDKLSLSFVLVLGLIGLFMNYAVEYPEAGHLLRLEFVTNFQKQSLFFLIGAFIFIGATALDRRIIQSLAYPVYIFSLVSLLAVLIFGSTVKGSSSWFIIGGFSLQPAEFAKFGTVLALASFLSHYTTKLSKMSDRLVSFAIIASPIILIFLQPDAGSATVFLALFFVLLRAGANPAYYYFIAVALSAAILSLVYPLSTVLFLILLLAAGFLSFKQSSRASWILSLLAIMSFSGLLLFQTGSWWSLLPEIGFILVATTQLIRQNQWQPPILILPALAILIGVATGTNYTYQNALKLHQKERINVWLNPEECDPQGALYNLLQSKAAIGSGGWTGKGYLKGAMTQLDYVPEQSTDFIFSTVGEEFGFLGSFFLIGICFGLIFRVLYLADDMKNTFGVYYSYGVASIFFFHVMVNIGMTVGLLPVVGIPLPFVSYGGSSFLAFSIMFAILFRLQADDKK